MLSMEIPSSGTSDITHHHHHHSHHNQQHHNHHHHGHHQQQQQQQHQLHQHNYEQHLLNHEILTTPPPTTTHTPETTTTTMTPTPSTIIIAAEQQQPQPQHQQHIQLHELQQQQHEHQIVYHHQSFDHENKLKEHKSDENCLILSSTNVTGGVEINVTTAAAAANFMSQSAADWINAMNGGAQTINAEDSHSSQGSMSGDGTHIVLQFNRQTNIRTIRQIDCYIQPSALSNFKYLMLLSLLLNRKCCCGRETVNKYVNTVNVCGKHVRSLWSLEHKGEKDCWENGNRFCIK